MLVCLASNDDTILEVHILFSIILAVCVDQALLGISVAHI